MNKVKLYNSEIVEIGEGNPVVGVVGLLHGDECCGRVVLDELAASLKPKSKVKLVYANLAAEKLGRRECRSNLNRVFPGDEYGDIENRTAYELVPHLAECDYVIDIHSTSYPSRPFVISTLDTPDFDRLASFTGLERYVIMVEKMAKGGSLIDSLKVNGRKGISFEAGTHQDSTSVMVARRVVGDFLVNLGVIEGERYQCQCDKFFGVDVIKVPQGGGNFRAYDNIRNFQVLSAGTPFGRDGTQEYSLDCDCIPFLYSDQLVDGNVFLPAVLTQAEVEQWNQKENHVVTKKLEE